MGKLHKFINHVTNFGMINTLDWLVLKKRNYKLYQDKIYHYLDDKYSDMMKSFCEESIESSEEETTYVWFFWAQGEEHMPSLVGKCYQSILERVEQCTVILLDMKNYKDYVQMDDFILKKLENGEFGFTHFSDLLRMKLLGKYGGLWLDATMYLAGRVNIQQLLNQGIFTLRSDNAEMYISKGNWSAFCIGCNQEYKVFMKCLDKLFESYWRTHDVLIDYYLIDYFILLLSNHSVLFREKLSRNKVEPIYWLSEHMNQLYNEDEWNRVMQKYKFFKLSYKMAQSAMENSYYSKLFL